MNKFCTIAGGNFGDDINTFLWESLFPNLHKLIQNYDFYGIGTVLGGRHDRISQKVVLGSGIGNAQPAAEKSAWDFRWVRGPKTAKVLGIPAQLGLGDPAILWHQLLPGNDVQGPIGLIPHFATWDSFNWNAVAHKAGMIAINPRQNPQTVIGQLRSCAKVLSESLHGAICADAMGIPWAPCVLTHRFNDFKWLDWLATVNRPFTPCLVDRPLVGAISPLKALANTLAVWAHYQSKTRRPHLRPRAVSTLHDLEQVANQLHRYAVVPAHFGNSTTKVLNEQRFKMLRQCEKFADDYQLNFTPPFSRLD